MKPDNLREQNRVTAVHQRPTNHWREASRIMPCQQAHQAMSSAYDSDDQRPRASSFDRHDALSDSYRSHE